MSRLQELGLAYVLFLVLISAMWVPLHGWEEAKRRIVLLPVFWIGTTVVLGIFAAIVWLVLPPALRPVL